ncbi:MAG TPA: hypothetical protein VLU43_00125 [Anaeromyxobacteraceae bacterium]|nr:hypothetical protein [Anaeromyxobacteraceae bacterium]
MRRRARILAAALALALAPACRRTGPAETYRAFVAAAREGDEAAVWSMLSAGSRAALDARARAVAARAGNAVPATGRMLLAGDSAIRAPHVRSVVVRAESADQAVVAVATEDGAEREARLVREGGAWRVVLPELAAQPGTP